MTPKLFRMLYLLASSELRRVESEIHDARARIRILENKAEEWRSIKDGTRDATCRSCIGNGEIQHVYAQDDIKFETCAVCKGSGLAA